MNSASAAIAGAFPPGHMVAGKYRVERVLGAGGMGVVLAAWDIALERRVALKLILPGATELPDASARFLPARIAVDGVVVAPETLGEELRLDPGDRVVEVE